METGTKTGFEKRKESMRRKAPEIKEAIARAGNLEELCTILNLAPSTLAKHCEACEIEFPSHLGAYRTNPSMDKKIDARWSAPKIAKAEGVSVQRVHQYIFETGQLAKWKSGRKKIRQAKSQKKREAKNLRSRIASLLKAHVFQRAEQEGWAYAKAAEYELFHNIPDHPFEKILAFFIRYQEAKEAGRKDGLQKLSGGLNLTYSQIYSVLEAVDLTSLQDKSKPRRVTQEEKERLERSVCLGMSAADIGYFAGVGESIAQSFFRRTGIKSAQVALPQINNEKLTYRTASKIYEAQDADFTVSETAELVDASEGMVSYALKNRENIERKIVQALRVIYWDNTIAKPYV